MSIKVIVTAVGQHIIADIKQIENKDSNEIVGYWLDKPRVIAYSRAQDNDNVSIGFVNFCLVSDEQAFSMKADHVVSILEPRADVAEKYSELVAPLEAPTPENDEPSSAVDPEEPAVDAGEPDGAA